MSNPRPPEPTCKAILLCQKTIIEEGTGSVSLISVLDGFRVGQDLTTSRADAFCQITGACGLYHLTIQIEDLSQGTIIAVADGGEIQIDDRLLKANIIIPIPKMTFAHAGEFDFVVFANGSEIDRQKFRITQR